MILIIFFVAYIMGMLAGAIITMQLYDKGAE